MKMIECTKQQFEKVINSFDQEELTIGNDVGRTYGISCYQRGGRVIGSSRWFLDFKVQERVWTYKVANYLFETYIK